MPRPLVIDYLRTHTFADLEEEHGVKAHPASRGACEKFSLNYDQLKVRPGDPLAEQCRGMVVCVSFNQAMTIDEENLWKGECPGELELLAWPMNRFYNSGEATAAEIEWSSARVLEKFDGTMIVLYHDGEAWCVATRSVPNADIPLNSNGIVKSEMTFTSLFKEGVKNTLDMDFDTWTKTLPEAYTYVFELTSPHNRVVVKYDETRITWLAARHTELGIECDTGTLRDQLFLKNGAIMPPAPVEYPLSNLEACAAYVNLQDPAQMEGVVIIDRWSHRVKVKNAKWVLSSKMHDSITSSRRNVLEAILTQKIDDVLPLLDDDTRREVELLIVRVGRYISKIDKQFAEWSSASGGDRKMFAAAVIASGDFKSPYFYLFERRYEDAGTCLSNLCETGRLSRDTLDYILSLADNVQ